MPTSSAVNDAVSVALASGLALNGVLLYSFGSAWFRRGAPFVPTAQRKVDAIFHPKRGLLRALPRRRHMVDLGSGGGALVRAAVRQGGFEKSTGYEINGALVAYARLRSLLHPNETSLLLSLWDADVSSADVVFVYGVPSILADLQAKLHDELPAGAHVVSNAFPFPKSDSWVEVERTWVNAGLSDGTLDDSSLVYLYRLSRRDGRDEPPSSARGRSHEG